MELLTLLLVLFISGRSDALHPKLNFTQTAELHEEDLTQIGENRAETTTERQNAEQEERSGGVTPKMEEERRGEAGLFSQADSKKSTTEGKTRRRAAGIRERKGGIRGRRKQRKAAKVKKIKNCERLLERQRKVNRTTEGKKPSVPAIFQIITQPQDPPPPPPHNAPLSPPFTPTPAPPPALYTQVRVRFSPPSVNMANPPSSRPTSSVTAERGRHQESDLVSEEVKNKSLKPAQKERETLAGETPRKINPGNRQKKAGNIFTPQAATPKPREAKFTVTDFITEESNPLSESKESISTELAKPARKPGTAQPATGRPKNVQPTEIHTDVSKVKQSKASPHQPRPVEPVANIYQTTARTPSMRPTLNNRANKNKTAKKSKEREDTSNKTQTVPSNTQEFNLLMSFPFMDDYCPPVCSCYNSVVQCSNKSVGRVPYGIPYGTRQILLMNNYIKGIQLDLFAKYNSMEVLVLSNNWLTDGAIKGAFSQIPALKHLYLDGNRLKSVPTDLPVSLEELRLDNNYLRAISEGAWSRCPGLFILRLSNNNLGPGSIPDAALSSLRNLHTLSLDHNQLTSIPLGLPLLIKELYLKGNLIEQVREDAFHKMWALEVLDLSANRLTNAGLRNSLNATRLESLSLEGNRLEHVPRHLPPSLKSLNLEGNFISSIKKADFSRLKELELLGLARNKIFEVAPGAFRELAALHRLDLCHNALQQVPRQLPRGLHSVALTDNRIQSVPHDAFCWGDRTRSVRGFVRVHLEHNLIDVGKMDVQSFRCLQGFQLVHSY